MGGDTPCLKKWSGLHCIENVNVLKPNIEGDTVKSGWRGVLIAIGPGVLMAGAAIGGSHLVASTQAGAKYGWQLLWLMLLVNLCKYPFFLYAQRYTAAAGETILHGYQRLGGGYLWAFFVLNILTTVVNIAGVGYITASLLTNFLPGSGDQDLTMLTGVVLAVCGALIIGGRYSALDKVGKLVVFVLAISTMVATVACLGHKSEVAADFVAPSIWQLASLGFIIPFMGWMPAPIEISVWPSMWMKSRELQTGHRITVRETMIDFHIGYVTTVVLAVFFLALGALILHGTGVEFAESGVKFASQLIGMYTETIGNWAYWIIAISAFSAMFSTVLTCVDGYPRAIAQSGILLSGKGQGLFRIIHTGCIVVSLAASFVVVKYYLSDLRSLLDFAMALSFVTAPFFAWINYRVICSDVVPEHFRPGPFMKFLSWGGLIFLTGFTVAWLVWQLKWI